MLSQISCFEQCVLHDNVINVSFCFYGYLFYGLFSTLFSSLQIHYVPIFSLLFPESP